MGCKKNGLKGIFFLQALVKITRDKKDAQGVG